MKKHQRGVRDKRRALQMLRSTTFSWDHQAKKKKKRDGTSHRAKMKKRACVNRPNHLGEESLSTIGETKRVGPGTCTATTIGRKKKNRSHI